MAVSYDPLSALFIVVIYATISVCSYHFGKKAREHSQSDAPQPISNPDSTQPAVSVGEDDLLNPENASNAQGTACVSNDDLASVQLEGISCTQEGGNIPETGLVLSRHKDRRSRLLRRLPTICCALSVLFFVLWVAQAQDKSDLALLINSASEAVYDEFSVYSSTCDDGDYWRMVAEFKVFEQAYVLYYEKAGHPQSGAQCSEIYEVLSTDPDRAKPHLEEFSASIYACGHSVGMERAYMWMAELHDILTQ